MPSFIHEALVEIFRQCPSLAVTLATEQLEIALPDAMSIAVTAADIRDLQPADRRADMVLKVFDETPEDSLDDETHGSDDPEDRSPASRPSGRTPYAAFILEMQLERDGDKEFSWPFYVTGLRARLRCRNVALVVVTLDQPVAEWCARPIDLGFGRGFVQPIVIGPSQIPAITDIDVADAAPELAVLSVAAHTSDSEETLAAIARAALQASGKLDTSRASLYSDFVFAILAKTAKPILEELMKIGGYTLQTEFARKHFGRGMDKGRKQALEKMLRLQLEHRFGPLSDVHQQRIEHATADELEQWVERILDAETANQVFDSDSAQAASS